VAGILVETDLIVEFLTAGGGRQSLLRRLLSTVSCFSTFVQASEVYSVCGGDSDRAAVDRALFGLKILGASSRYSKTIGLLLSSSGSMRGHRTAIVAAMALESRLALVTDTHFDAHSSVKGLRLYSASALRRTKNSDELTKALTDSST
jgi:hypothetical protein